MGEGEDVDKLDVSILDDNIVSSTLMMEKHFLKVLLILKSKINY